MRNADKGPSSTKVTCVFFEFKVRPVVSLVGAYLVWQRWVAGLEVGLVVVERGLLGSNLCSSISGVEWV